MGSDNDEFVYIINWVDVVEQIKTFFITAHLGQPHGSAKSARDFARVLLATQDRVCIISPWKEDFGDFAAGYPLSTPRWYTYRHRQPLSIKSPLSIITILIRLFLRWRIQRAMKGHRIIVNGWASYAYWRELKSSGYRSTTIIVRESPRHYQFKEHSGTFDAMFKGFSEFNKLIFVSNRTREDWTRFPVFVDKPAVTLYNCCEEEEIERLRPSDRSKMRCALGLDERDYVVIVPGQIEKRKGLDIVLNALGELIKDIPHLRLILLGDPGTAWAKTMVEKIDSGACGNIILRIPAQPSALIYLYSADVLLFPSRAESLPRTVLEAMAIGMPIVASDVDGIPELIEHSVSGWLFSLDSPDEMIRGMALFANQPSIAHKNGVAAKLRYYECFSRKQQIEGAKAMVEWLKSDLN